MDELRRKTIAALTRQVERLNDEKESSWWVQASAEAVTSLTELLKVLRLLKALRRQDEDEESVCELLGVDIGGEPLD